MTNYQLPPTVIWCSVCDALIKVDLTYIGDLAVLPIIEENRKWQEHLQSPAHQINLDIFLANPPDYDN